MKKVLRMSTRTYTKDETFQKTLEMVKANLDVIDEITMFTATGHHGYCPIEDTAKNAELLRKRISQYKEAGVRKVGINQLSTLGHTEDGSGLHEKAQLQYMVNEKGEESGSCLCPADERFLDYIAQRYSLIADTGADYVWMDDDVRIGNHGVVSGFCYCPKCIEKYNRTYGTDYTFEYITSHWDEDAELRKTWKESAYDTMSVMVKTIHNAVKSVNPNAEIGYMSGGANPIYEWILASGAKKGRPGGGFYDDRFPLELFWKSFWIQWELSNYPKTVTDIQYEYETYNFRTLEKSMHTSEMETSLALMTGCNGVLYNRFVFEPYFFDMLRGSAEKWEVLTQINEGCENAGVFCAYAPSAQALNEISIPVTAVLENSVAAFVLGDEWNNYEDDMVEKILQKNVLTDGRGVEVLRERGFADYVGASIERSFKNGVCEVFSEHEMNGDYKGDVRPVSMDIFHETDAYAMELLEGAECLSKLSGNHGISMYKYENKKGTKFVGDGCLMPGQMQTASKRTQMKNVYEWLSGGKLPVIIEKSIKVIPTVRNDKKGTMNIMLSNVSFDKTGKFELIIRGTGNFVMLGEKGERIPLRQRSLESETIVEIDNINGWDYVLLTNKV